MNKAGSLLFQENIAQVPHLSRDEPLALDIDWSKPAGKVGT